MIQGYAYDQFPAGTFPPMFDSGSPLIGELLPRVLVYLSCIIWIASGPGFKFPWSQPDDGIFQSGGNENMDPIISVMCHSGVGNKKPVDVTK